jgi:hypothetical protein
MNGISYSNFRNSELVPVGKVCGHEEEPAVTSPHRFALSALRESDKVEPASGVRTSAARNLFQVMKLAAKAGEVGG